MAATNALARTQSQLAIQRSSSNARMANIRSQFAAKTAGVQARMKMLRDSFALKLVVGFGSAGVGVIVGAQLKRINPMGYGGTFNMIAGGAGLVILVKARGRYGGLIIGAGLLGMALSELGAWAFGQDWFDEMLDGDDDEEKKEGE
jgi:hypothetical protein